MSSRWRSVSRSSAARLNWVSAPRQHDEHTRVFLERYSWLRDWAVRLSDGNHSEAEDLVHDAFLQFVLRRRNLAEIGNLEGYLYGLLRRLRLSSARKALRRRQEPLIAVDYDSAELCLRAADVRERLQVQQELSAVCEYACLRKESSKAGSVLILRFFHGFYPKEIASILACSLHQANDWLYRARTEARASLEHPSALALMPANRGRHGVHNRLTTASAREVLTPASPDAIGLLNVLRTRIARARTGACLAESDIERLYGESHREPIECATLSHIVSCPACLDRVTRHLRLGDYSDRNPMDMLGCDDSFFTGRPGSGANGSGAMFRESVRRFRELAGHRPAELVIAANGLLVGTLKVRSADSELEIAVNLDEPIDFIEIFSEQQVRLLLFELQPAAAGGVEQTEHIAFEDGRTLDLRVSFANAWPIVHVAYRDPAFAGASAAANPASEDTEVVPAPDAAVSAIGRLRDRRRDFWSLPLLRPAFGIVTVLAVLALLVLVPWRGRTVSARELLQSVRVSERTLWSAPNTVLHRVLVVEERRPPARRLVSRQRVDAWHDSRRGLSVRRLYDENNRVAAGEWVAADGTHTVYRPGVTPKTVPPRDVKPLDPDWIWTWDPSSQHFAEVVPADATPTVETAGEIYRVRYRTDSAASSPLVEATLTIRKADLRALAQTIVLNVGGELREYEFTESGLTSVPTTTVPAATFEPEPELVGRPLPRELTPTVAPAERPRAIATLSNEEVTRLEVDAVFGLHRLESCLTEPVSLTRGPRGLRGRASASNAACREAVARGVTAFGSGGHVDIDVELAPPSGDATTTSGSDLSPASLSAPYRTLVDRLGAAPARTLAASALQRSARALAEAREVERLIAAWPTERLHALDPDRLTMVLDVVRDHARRSRRESDQLRQQLASAFAIDLAKDSTTTSGAVEVHTVGDVPAAVARLVSLAAAHDLAIRQIFDAGLNAPRVPVDVVELVRSLRESERQALWFDEPWRD